MSDQSTYTKDVSIINWIKNHKLAVVLLLVVIYLLLSRSLFNTNYSSMQVSPPSNSGIGGRGIAPSVSSLALPSLGSTDSESSAPAPSSRMVIQESSLSLVVSDVRKVGDQIITFSQSLGGFMVTSSYSKPNDSPFGTVTVRVPTEKLNESLNYFRSLGLKIVSENLMGRDVTSEYTDIEARLATLRKTQSKFNEMLDKAVTIQETLNVEREIINIQTQIDSLVGQQKALKENADLTRITLYLSTDELALPYTPDQTFRPSVIFKLAVRSLIGTLRDLGDILIWIGVYSIIWLPILIGIIIYRKWRSSKQTIPH